MIVDTIQINNSIDSRLDIYLVKELHPISRSRIKTYIDKSFVLVNNKKTKPSYILQKGDIININIKDDIQADKKLIAEKNESEGGLSLFRAHRGLPKYKPLIKYLSELGTKAIMQKIENYYLTELDIISNQFVTDSINIAENYQVYYDLCNDFSFLCDGMSPKEYANDAFFNDFKIKKIQNIIKNL